MRVNIEGKMDVVSKVSNFKTGVYASKNARKVVSSNISFLSIDKLELNKPIQRSMTGRFSEIVSKFLLKPHDKYAQDNQYRMALAKAAGCRPEDLKSVVGMLEFNDILKKLKSDQFVTGKNLENIENGTFRANLHTHTTDSDGKATIESLLNQAAKYADKVAAKYPNSDIPPFTLALTNHDTIKDCQEAIRIIARNPEKFKNLKFVPGIEFSTRFIGDGTLLKPDARIEMESIGYCINPFDEKITGFIENRHKANHQYGKQVFEKLNKWMNNYKFNLDEVKKENVYLKIEGSPAFPEELLKHMRKTFENKIKEIYAEHEKDAGHHRLTSFTPTIREVSSLIKQSGFGELGVSHPGRIEKLYKSLVFNKIPIEKAMALFLEKLKSLGIKVIESEYQYPDTYKGDYSTKEIFDSSIINIRQTCDAIGLLKSGGLDTHSINLFLNKDPKRSSS